jgi:putative spermidine/putrescine transport system permease protein
MLSNPRALLLFAPLLLLLIAFVFFPLIRLVVTSLGSGEGLQNYADVFTRAAGRRALVTTIVGAVLVTAITVPIGALLSWYLVTVSNPWVRSLILLSVLVPVWMGTVVKNYAFILLVARNGALNKLLGLFGLGPLELLYTSVAVVIGMVYTMIPYAVLSLYGVFATIDLSLVSAARSLGATRVHAVRTIVLPLAAPGIMASTSLVFAISLGFYVTPVLLGGAQAPFMASLIRDSVFSFFDLPFASAASVVLLAVAIAVLGLALSIVGRERLMRAVL